MTTKPTHDYESISRDALHLAAVAEEDVHDKAFAEHVDKHEIDVFAANARKLKAGAAAQTNKLHEQVGAGVHVAVALAALATATRAIRNRAELLYLTNDESRDETAAKSFGWGHTLDATSMSSVESLALAQIDAAKADPKKGAKVHLDTKGIHHLEAMLSAVEGTDIAHTKTRTNRHDATTAVQSLAHLVIAEASHLRFVAHRVYAGDESKLARYASTLPRHEVKHRSRHAPEPTPAPADGTTATAPAKS
jgi:hypothetical protein